MKKKSEKQQDLDKLKTELAKVSTVILTTFQGITVENDTKLRRAVQAAGGKYQVVKNTIAERENARDQHTTEHGETRGKKRAGKRKAKRKVARR